MLLTLSSGPGDCFKIALRHNLVDFMEVAIDSYLIYRWSWLDLSCVLAHRECLSLLNLIGKSSCTVLTNWVPTTSCLYLYMFLQLLLIILRIFAHFALTLLAHTGSGSWFTVPDINWIFWELRLFLTRAYHNARVGISSGPLLMLLLNLVRFTFLIDKFG